MKVEEEVVMELEREEEEGLKEKEEMREEAMMEVEGEETEVVEEKEEEEVSLEFGFNGFSANGGGAYMIDMCICVCSGG